MPCAGLGRCRYGTSPFHATMTEPATGTEPPRRIRSFLGLEVAGTVVLLAATATALVWANLPVGDTYERLWHTPLAVHLGDQTLQLDLRHWVNDGLMALFFFVVGMEAAREFTRGEMRDRRKAATPVLAALGGLAIPPLIYLAINSDGPAARGFGIAMATDTAFALGLLTVLGPRCPEPLRRFLLTLAVIDDVVAILVIGVFYTETLAWVPVATALALLGLILLLRWLGVWRAQPYALLSVGIWLAAVYSGLHPTVVGIVLGVLVQVSTPSGAHPVRARDAAHEFALDPTPLRGRQAASSIRAAVPTNDRLTLLLQPWTTYLIVPLFALANAGVRLDGEVLARAVTSPVTIGVAVALVVGKLGGVLLGTWIALRSRVGTLSGNLVWGQLAGGAAVAGIGFTISLFIAELAFADELTRTDAKVGILGGSLIAAGLGWLIFRLAWTRGGQCAPDAQPDAPGVAQLQEPVSADDHVRGPDDALVTVVEYGDFECPYCGRMYSVVENLTRTYGDTLRFVFRHYPLPEVHPRAMAAALAAEAAGKHGRFWEMSEQLFQHQDRLDDESLMRHAGAVGVPPEDVVGHDAHHHETEVEADVQSGRHSGVRGTPTFYVNDLRYDGPLTEKAFTAHIEEAMAQAMVSGTR
jgi:NhaA family Na+:H+ antiporter